MELIKNILFPVDFSPSCVAMGSYIRRAAAMLDARVSLVHVFSPSSSSGSEIIVRSPVEIAEEHRQIARKKLDAFLHDEFPVSDFPRILACGDPAAAIVATARKGFDAIMMPTHAGRFRRMLLGSTTAKVLNDADCIVATSRHVETIAPRPMQHREWLCAIGLSDDSERVLRSAYCLSQQAGANLRIIHAIQSSGRRLPIRLDIEEQVQSEERRVVGERIDALQKKVGCQAPVRIAVGPVRDALLDAARLSDADALIIGRSPRPGSQSRLQDLTYAMIRDSPFPVLSL